MKRRFVAALIVALAVLFGQSGGLVLAAVCPHLRSAQPERENACHTNTHEVAAEHHQPEEAKTPAFETAGVRCNHCVVHSRNKREEESVLQQPNTSQQRDEEHRSAGPIVKLQPPSFSTTIAWAAKAQGPPGPNAPLHILLNVFRI